MTNVLPLHQPLARLDDDAWDDLLNFIEERRVIPIIGPELLKVETETGPRLLYDWIADKLAARLNVDTARLPQPHTPNDVVCWFLSSHGRREDAFSIENMFSLAPPDHVSPLVLRRPRMLGAKIARPGNGDVLKGAAPGTDIRFEIRRP